MTGLLLALLAQAPDGGPTWTQLALANTREREQVVERAEDGTHVRFGTATQGPVHVWWPRGLRRSRARTVVYVHGFYTDADGAVLGQGLLTQFRDSGLEAVFIVPEARSWRTDAVLWRDLPALLAAVESRTRQRLPEGPVVAVGHSGANRTIAEWLTHPRLRTVLLVDGLYGGDEDLLRWVRADAQRRLVLAGQETWPRTQALARRLPEAQVLDEVPFLFDPLAARLRQARVVLLRSDRFDHMELVEARRFLPWLLHTFGG